MEADNNSYYIGPSERVGPETLKECGDRCYVLSAYYYNSGYVPTSNKIACLLALDITFLAGERAELLLQAAGAVMNAIIEAAK